MGKSIFVGRSRVLAVEEARELVRRLYLNKPSAKVSSVESGSRHFELIPKLRHLRHRLLQPAGLPSSPSLVATRLSNQALDETILTKLVYDAPRAVGFKIYSLGLGRSARVKDSVWNSDGALIGLVRNDDLDLISISTSLALGSLVSAGKISAERAIDAYRQYSAAAGCDGLEFLQSEERKLSVIIGKGVDVFRATSPERPKDVVLFDDPEEKLGAGEPRRCYRLGFQSFSENSSRTWGKAWPSLVKCWETARSNTPKGEEIWEVQLLPRIEQWDEARQWINANIPGPFEGPVSIGMASEAVDEILRDETEEGQYVEVYWKKILGSMVLVSAVRCGNGWKFQVNTHDEVKEDKASKLREDIERMAGVSPFWND